MSTSSASRAALVTGAAQRIGREIACALADAGWNVALHFRSSREAAEETLAELTRRGGTHCLLQADLGREEETRRLFAEAVSELGQLDAVINNASRFEYDDVNDFGTPRLLDHMLPNLAAPVILAQELYRHVQTRRPTQAGIVVNLLDQKLDNPNPDFLSYTLSKSALKSATILLARALAPHVRVVGVSPGLTLPSYLQTEAQFRQTHRMAPLGRASTPADIARSVLFLLESPAITGIDLAVDGGQHLQCMERDFSMMGFET
jgi:NAD(P)-dependent dehydrogenase (short-subunit alcohol dehydrogenase family)